MATGLSVTCSTAQNRATGSRIAAPFRSRKIARWSDSIPRKEQPEEELRIERTHANDRSGVRALRLYPQFGAFPIRRCPSGAAGLVGPSTARGASLPSGSTTSRSGPLRTSGSTSLVRRRRDTSAIAEQPDLVVSVCDRAHEKGPPFSTQPFTGRYPIRCWSVPPKHSARLSASWQIGSTGSPSHPLARRDRRAVGTDHLVAVNEADTMSTPTTRTWEPPANRRRRVDHDPPVGGGARATLARQDQRRRRSNAS